MRSINFKEQWTSFNHEVLVQFWNKSVPVPFSFSFRNNCHLCLHNFKLFSLQLVFIFFLYFICQCVLYFIFFSLNQLLSFINRLLTCFIPHSLRHLFQYSYSLFCIFDLFFQKIYLFVCVYKLSVLVSNLCLNFFNFNTGSVHLFDLIKCMKCRIDSLDLGKFLFL